MERNRKQVNRIEQALVLAHKAQTAPDLPPEWREGVMRHVRRLGAGGDEQASRRSTSLVFRRMILPAAAAGGLVAAALLAYMLTALPGMEQDLFAVLTQDPSGLLVTAALGL